MRPANQLGQHKAKAPQPEGGREGRVREKGEGSGEAGGGGGQTCCQSEPDPTALRLHLAPHLCGVEAKQEADV